MSAPAYLPEFAAAEYRRRSDYAQRFVSAGTWSRDEATAKLRPWLAIALLCSANMDDLGLLPDVREQLDAHLADHRWRDQNGSWHYTDGECRSVVAHDFICPRITWAPELARARDAAFDAAAKDPAAADHAAGIAAICMAIGHDHNGRHHVFPYRGIAASPIKAVA